MPSENDDPGRRALEALARPREEFHSALVATLEQVRSVLGGQAVTAEQRASRATAELGAFAAGRIDIGRFASLTETGTALDEGSALHIERAARTLESLLARGNDLFRARVEPGGHLPDVVERALAEAGRAFGAARTAELIRAGRYEAEKHDGWTEHFAPAAWSRRERGIAPPLVVEVEGRDLRTGGLAEFMDGSQKILLLVGGPAPAAALVRLVTPGVFVMQTDDPARLARVGETEGPGVAALVPSEAGRFVHTPGVDGGPGRLVVEHLPEEGPKRALGALSAFRQAEELRHLAALAASLTAGGAGVGPAAAGPPGAAAVAADRTEADVLAAWILRQADLAALD